jgi:hypothetical protein
MNIDRVLEGDAKSWHTSEWPHIVRRIAALPENDDNLMRGEPRRMQQIDMLWEQFKANLLQFFDHTSQKQSHRQKNRELTFTFEKDPQTYVTSKLEILRHVDPGMSDDRKVEQLIRGLPYTAQENFALQTIATPHEFLEKLRKAKEIYMANFYSKSKQSHSSDWTKNEFQLAEFKPNTYQRTDDDKPICAYCNVPGHVWKKCRKRLAEGQSQGQVDQSQTKPQFQNTYANQDPTFFQTNYQSNQGNQFFQPQLQDPDEQVQRRNPFQIDNQQYPPNLQSYNQTPYSQPPYNSINQLVSPMSYSPLPRLLKINPPKTKSNQEN